MDERQMELMYNFSFSPAKYQISTPVLLTPFFFLDVILMNLGSEESTPF